MMCGFVGFSNLNKDISFPKNTHILKILTKSLSHRGPDEEAFYTSRHVNLGHRRLIIIDSENGKQPMSFKYADNTYTIVYNGQLYNAIDIRKELMNLGYEFKRILRYRSNIKSIYSIWYWYI